MEDVHNLCQVVISVQVRLQLERHKGMGIGSHITTREGDLELIRLRGPRDVNGHFLIRTVAKDELCIREGLDGDDVLEIISI